MIEHDYVNFSEEHELNYHLKKVNKRQTEDNRAELVKMGDELKSELDKDRLTHSEFHPYVQSQSHRLE
jgi:hypothetical protein